MDKKIKRLREFAAAFELCDVVENMAREYALIKGVSLPEERAEREQLAAEYLYEMERTPIDLPLEAVCMLFDILNGRWGFMIGRPERIWLDFDWDFELQEAWRFHAIDLKWRIDGKWLTGKLAEMPVMARQRLIWMAHHFWAAESIPGRSMPEQVAWRVGIPYRGN